jgi:hypothetical protein
MAWFGSSRREKSATANNPAGAPPRPRGDLPGFRDSRALSREVAVAKSISEAAGIDAVSLAGNGGQGLENQATVEVRLDGLSSLRQSTETLEAKLEQGVFGERERPLIEAELRRRQDDEKKHDISELRERLAELERRLRDKDAELRSGQRWIGILVVIAVIFTTAWVVEIVPPLMQIIDAP